MAASRKYPGIRPPLHPLRLRCAPCDEGGHSFIFRREKQECPPPSSVARLAGAAHRRSRGGSLFSRRYTRGSRRVESNELFYHGTDRISAGNGVRNTGGARPRSSPVQGTTGPPPPPDGCVRVPPAVVGGKPLFSQGPQIT